ncbi:hypothetical protein MMC26_002603 [Xylographa opegraphella]|nr:hypothetical protein [Xylographa opegraphella]
MVKMQHTHQASVAQIYDARSEQYDNAFHAHIAADFVEWANLRTGDSVLDLAAGTGLVAVPAARKVGPGGRVVAVDISDGMMDVGRRKAAKEGLAVEFVNHDIADLGSLALVAEETRGFDVITCCSALVLLKNPTEAIKHWASLLAVGGRLLVDTPCQIAMVASFLLDEVARDVDPKAAPIYDPAWIVSQRPLQEACESSGLTTRVFQTDAYEQGSYSVDDGPKVFERYYDKSGLIGSSVPDVKEKCKQLFLKAFGNAAAPSGVVREEVRLHVAIGVKHI